jgi:hypothetical protein
MKQPFRTLVLLSSFVTFGPIILWQVNGQTKFEPEKRQDPPNNNGDMPDIKNTFPLLLPDEPLKPGKNDDDLRKLLIARFNAASEETRDRVIESTPRTHPIDKAVNAANRLIQSRIELIENPEDEIAVREEFLSLAKHIEKLTESLLKVGRCNTTDVALARYMRLDAEILLLKLKSKARK